ncbi:MAG: hypothetical protein V4495_21405 [Pseudomonadota bacterium]
MTLTNTPKLETQTFDCQPRLVLVDTNCFLRLYHSPVRPFLGEIVGGYKLLTLNTLIQEFHRSKRLQEFYAWLMPDIKAEDLSKVAIQTTIGENASIKQERIDHEGYVQSVISLHCQKENTSIRSLSGRDLDLLATAIVMEAVVATDEWPLRLVVNDLMSVAGEYEMGLFSSVDMLHLLEVDGKLTPDDRKMTIKSWLRYEEKLPREWREVYRRLFGEQPPSL